MPIPRPLSEEKGSYRGVEIRRNEKTGTLNVIMSHNKHRFIDVEDAKDFIDGAYETERKTFVWKK